jgi:hypothetical protein
MVVGIGFRGVFFLQLLYLKNWQKFPKFYLFNTRKISRIYTRFSTPQKFPNFFSSKKHKNFPPKKKTNHDQLASCAFNSKITNSLSIMCELPNTTYHSWDHMKTSTWHMTSSSYIVMSVTNLRCEKFWKLQYNEFHWKGSWMKKGNERMIS